MTISCLEDITNIFYINLEQASINRNLANNQTINKLYLYII